MAEQCTVAFCNLKSSLTNCSNEFCVAKCNYGPEIDNCCLVSTKGIFRNLLRLGSALHLSWVQLLQRCTGGLDSSSEGRMALHELSVPCQVSLQLAVWITSSSVPGTSSSNTWRVCKAQPCPVRMPVCHSPAEVAQAHCCPHRATHATLPTLSDSTRCGALLAQSQMPPTSPVFPVPLWLNWKHHSIPMVLAVCSIPFPSSLKTQCILLQAKL